MARFVLIRTILATGVFLAGLAVAPADTAAQELRIGQSTITTSADPHYYDIGPNIAAREHVYEALFRHTADMHFVPLLAESTATESPTRWVIRLRRDVKFSDGTPLTADDVVATLARLSRVQGSPSSYVSYIYFVDRVEARDPHTVVITTKSPFPNLPQYLAPIGIIPRRIAEQPEPIRFDDPASAIGTGPYLFRQFVPNDHLVLVRNEAYRGEKEPWAKVTFRQITNPGSRTAALLAGDVDLIDDANPPDIGRIEASPNATIVKGDSYFIIFLQAFAGPDAIPGVRGEGSANPLANPLADRRVRAAISLAINRDAIVDRVLDHLARPAAQIVPESFLGYNPAITVPQQDPVRAKALLAEAGYKDGFDLTLSAPQGRYMNDDKVAQAVAQMLARISIRTTVDTMPVSMLFTRRNRGELALFLGGFGTNTGEASFPLLATAATRDPARGSGRVNFTSYSNPTLDHLLDQAGVEMDEAQRGKLLREAMSIAIVQDHAIIPLHQQFNIWGVRKGLIYQPRMDDETLAMSTRPADRP